MSKLSLDKLAEYIGTNIRKRREKKELTQEAFSKLAGIDAKALWNIEMGKNLPSIRILVKIGSALDVRLRNFLP